MSMSQRLDKRVTIKEKSVTRASNGEEVVIWVPFAALTPAGDGKVWAEVEPIRGREFFAAAQMQGAAYYRVTLRYTPLITRAMRVYFGSIILEITAEPINVKSASRVLELMCVSGVRDG